MKKLVISLLLLCVLLPAYALADTKADPYLVDTPWEMTVANYGFVRYMDFDSDGTGFMAVPVVYSSYTGESKIYCEIYDFTWSSFVADGDDYVTIHFEGEYPGYGWGLTDVPYQHNTYYLLWNPDFMYLFDLNHSGLDEKQFDASKGLNLTRIDSIPYISTSEIGGYGAFGTGNGGGR
ncbi:MAG: hypothetical protein IJB25_13130 [Clostridia bacterium]|nr:hypothetical protein [Clostridia bacterium]